MYAIRSYYENLRLSRKLMAVFAAIVVLVGTLGGLSVLEVRQLGKATDDLAGNWMPSVNSARKMQYEMQAQRTVLYQLISSSSVTERLVLRFQDPAAPGSFRPPVDFAMSYGPSALAAGDVDA